MGELVSLPNAAGADYVADAYARREAFDARMILLNPGNLEMEILLKGCMTYPAELSFGIDRGPRGLAAAEKRLRKRLDGAKPLSQDLADRIAERIGGMLDDFEDGIARKTLRPEQREACVAAHRCWSELASVVADRVAADSQEATRTLADRFRMPPAAVR